MGPEHATVLAAFSAHPARLMTQRPPVPGAKPPDAPHACDLQEVTDAEA
jgi:hypothetical protein